MFPSQASLRMRSSSAERLSLISLLPSRSELTVPFLVGKVIGIIFLRAMVRTEEAFALTLLGGEV